MTCKGLLSRLFNHGPLKEEKRSILCCWEIEKCTEMQYSVEYPK